MVSINDNITGPDRQFASIASIMATTGFAEAAAALYDAGAATEVPASMRAQLDLVVNDRATQLQNEIDAAITEIRGQAVNYGNDEAVQNAINRVSRSGSIKEVGANRMAALADLDRAQNRAQDQNDVELRHAHMWAELAQEVAKTEESMRTLRRYMTPEEIAREKELTDAVNNTTAGSPERARAEAARATYQGEVAKEVADRNPNVPEVATAAGEVERSTTRSITLSNELANDLSVDKARPNAQANDSNSPSENLNAASAVSDPTEVKVTSSLFGAPPAVAAPVVPVANSEANSLTNNEDSTTRLAYADAPEAATGVPLQPTPASPAGPASGVTRL